MRRLPMLGNIVEQPVSLRSVLDLYAGSQQAQVELCANLIRSATGRVILTGMGASFFAALHAATRLEQNGFPVHAVESSELLHYGTSALRPGDVGILISRSGRSAEVILLAQKMRAAGATVIGVTNVPGGPLEEIAHHMLEIGARSDQLVAVQTYTGTTLALLLLAEQVLRADTSPLREACLAALPAFSSYIQSCLDHAETWRALFDGPGVLYLLGRGSALASAQEAALLLHETAKVAAVAMSCGQFRHGPVEVVSREFRAIVFATSLPTRALDAALANDLAAMGAAVRCIGPASSASVPEGNAEPLLAGPELDPAFAPVLSPLFEIVPLQVAAYYLALWRGITPGDFRYASEITSEQSGFPLMRSRLLAGQATQG